MFSRNDNTMPKYIDFGARKLSLKIFLAGISIKVLRTYFLIFISLRDFHLTPVSEYCRWQGAGR